MPFKPSKARLTLSTESREKLVEIARSRSQPMHRIERARALLAFDETGSVSKAAAKLGANRMTINRYVNKALELGVEAALEDLPRQGRAAVITQDAIGWIISLACRKPKEFGYSYEMWTTDLLAAYARSNCVKYGHPCLEHLARGTVSKILTKQEVRPHKIKYYLERRDPAFDSKFVDVLLFYKSVNFLLDTGLAELADTAFVSYDEKPGIQAIDLLAPDLPPVAGKHSQLSRDHEYRRMGTVSLMAGIDLLSGHVHGRIVERHHSREFITFLQMLDEHYAKEKTVRVILDNHSIHTSAETRAYLATQPNRFEFIFTPKHGSWLNLVETFFSKMARTMLRGIRVKSKDELIDRIMRYLSELNESPVIFRWRYGLEHD